MTVASQDVQNPAYRPTPPLWFFVARHSVAAHPVPEWPCLRHSGNTRADNAKRRFPGCAAAWITN